MNLFLKGSLAWHAAGAAGLVWAGTQAHAAIGPIAAGLFLDHLALMTGGLLPRSRWLGPNVSRLTGAARREIVLTFDDGPDPIATPGVLDRLDEAGARASFFLIGERARAYPDLVREIVRRGHVIENHTDTHRNSFWFHSPARLRGEIERTQDTIGPLAGRAPAWFRAPAGIRSPLLQPALERSGLDLVSWTRRAFDTRSANPQAITRRLVGGLAAGDILLMHDGNSPAMSGGRPVILESLPRVLEHLASGGFAAIPLPPPGSPGASPAGRDRARG